MKTFSIRSLGCKVNHYESQQVRQALEHLGLAQVEAGQSPDLAVVNTCCVTATASAKSRQCIRRTQRLNPDAVVLVCGCLPSISTHELSCLGDTALVVRDRRDLPSQLLKVTGHHGCDEDTGDPPSSPHDVIRPNAGLQIKSKDSSGLQVLPALTRFEGQTRAFLKVQDGCDGCCAYCIVPRTRPALTSKPVRQAVAEAEALVGAGHREIVVTGVYLGAYGQHTVRRRRWPQGRNPYLVELLDALAQVPGLARVRLSSLDPSDVTIELVEVLRRRPNIMPHLHLSLQSGSDDVLRRMGRQYTTDDFRRIVAVLTSSLDRPALTTDIIVGLPGETDADFERTVTLAKAVGFARMHVFTFSPRRGTPAANMRQRVPSKVIQERSKVIRQLDRQLGRQFRDAFLGQTARVLIEDTEGVPSGLSERYFTVYLGPSGPPVHRNQIVKVTLQSHCKDGMLGEKQEAGSKR